MDVHHNINWKKVIAVAIAILSAILGAVKSEVVADFFGSIFN